MLLVAVWTSPSTICVITAVLTLIDITRMTNIAIYLRRWTISFHRCQPKQHDEKVATSHLPTLKENIAFVGTTDTYTTRSTRRL